MSNVLHLYGVNHFQLPKFLREWDTHNLRLNDLKLYIEVLYHVQERSTPTVKLLSRDLLSSLSINSRALMVARSKLVEAGLLQAAEVINGLWQYTLLHPVTKEPLEKNQFVGRNLNTLSAQEVRSFFDTYNLLLKKEQEDGGFKCMCPFHANQLGHGRNRSLSVSLNGGGVFFCHVDHCDARGKLVDFARLWLMKSAGHKDVSIGTAHKDVIRRLEQGQIRSRYRVTDTDLLYLPSDSGTSPLVNNGRSHLGDGPTDGFDGEGF